MLVADDMLGVSPEQRGHFVGAAEIVKASVKNQLPVKV
jgi:hypothetical protein